MTAIALKSRTLTDMEEAAMERLAVEHGEAPFRGRQLFGWVHGRLVTDLEATNLPQEFARRVVQDHPIARMDAVQELVSRDGATRKRLLALPDGQTVEAVLMEAAHEQHEVGRHTVCVSSQVGCALACSFCVTGQVGFSRHLSGGDIVEQVYQFERLLRGDASARGGAERRHVDNVVFMGMGEPLANYREVLSAIRLLVDPKGMGLGARRITVSTAGIVPGIHRLADESLQVGLAISLHAPNDELRSRIMPINRRYPIAELMAAADRYVERTGRRVTYEYAMIRDTNDGAHDARELAELLSRRLAHVNLIPLNQSLDLALKPSSPERIAAFRRVLEDARVPCTVRMTKGQDILAACGQLRYTANKK
jgi:23S rRNA (adenine2503-C2)-methyltransferase